MPTISFFFIDVCILVAACGSTDAKISITRSNLRPNGFYYKGELVFAEEFNTLDPEIWSHELTLGGNHNWEFQMYANSRVNSYVENGILYLKPTLTSDRYGMDFVYNGQMDLHGAIPIDDCTNALNYGCTRSGNYPHIINPIISSNVRTVNSFYFQYGRVEVRAKLPGGDWMWPSIKLMPRFNAYGSWPASGEINILESRGNRKLFMPQELWKNIGSESYRSILQFGPVFPINGYEATLTETQSTPDRGFDQDFHVFGMEWTDEYIAFTLDGREVRKLIPPGGGFWEMGNFDFSKPNPWKYALNKRMAPFDQKFFLVLNVAVGGINGYFPDDATDGPEGRKRKPWINSSDRASLAFFEAIDSWYPTWQENGTMQVDYVRVYAI